MKKEIKFGIKVSTDDFNLLTYIYNNQDIIDFIEILLKPQFSSENVLQIKELSLPYVIHIANSNYGIDFGDLSKDKNNLNYIRKINKFEKVLEPICFVVHPESGDTKLSINNIESLQVRPIALENMPLRGIYGGDLLGYDPFSLNIFFENIDDLEFCCDINHAIKTSISNKSNYLEFIRNLIAYKEPILFHISGGNLSYEIDEHQNLYEGQYDLKEIKKILISLGKELYMTFETPRVSENNIEDDLKNMRYFLEL